MWAGRVSQSQWRGSIQTIGLARGSIQTVGSEEQSMHLVGLVRRAKQTEGSCVHTLYVDCVV